MLPLAERGLMPHLLCTAKKEGKEVSMPVRLGSSMWVTAAQIGSSRWLLSDAGPQRSPECAPHQHRVHTNEAVLIIFWLCLVVEYVTAGNAGHLPFIKEKKEEWEINLPGLLMPSPILLWSNRHIWELTGLILLSWNPQITMGKALSHLCGRACHLQEPASS